MKLASARTVSTYELIEVLEECLGWRACEHELGPDGGTSAHEEIYMLGGGVVDRLAEVHLHTHMHPGERANAGW